MTTTAGEMSLAFTAASPTTSAPTMDIACPTFLGIRRPASRIISNAICSKITSKNVGNGTPSFELTMDKANSLEYFL